MDSNSIFSWIVHDYDRFQECAHQISQKVQYEVNSVSRIASFCGLLMTMSGTPELADYRLTAIINYVLKFKINFVKQLFLILEKKRNNYIRIRQFSYFCESSFRILDLVKFKNAKSY